MAGLDHNRDMTPEQRRKAWKSFIQSCLGGRYFDAPIRVVPRDIRLAEGVV